MRLLCVALIAQTNPNWLAYFIITDPSPFEKRLQEIISSFNDPRLAYYDVALAHRPVVRNCFFTLLLTCALYFLSLCVAMCV